MKKIYLAVPYSGMEDSSYEQVTEVLGKLLMVTNKQGARSYNVFSPITQCHPLTKIEGIELPGNWEYWEQIDKQFVEWCEEVFVFIPKEGMETVRNSTGVKAEIEMANKQGKLVRFLQLDNNNNLVFM